MSQKANKTVLITGANRGIGLEFVKHYSNLGWKVLATTRSSSKDLSSLSLNGGFIIEGVDVGSDESVANLASRVGKDLKIDVLINNSGALSFDGTLTEGKFNGKLLNEQFNVNSVGPLRVTAALKDNLKEGSKVVILTTIFASVELMKQQPNAGVYGYKMSKAAVNMAGVNLAIELKPLGIPVVLVHPGAVDTDMARPFNIPKITTIESVQGITKVIEGASLDNSGNFFSYDGSILPW